MKKLPLIVVIGLLATNSNARINPFEPTDTFYDQQKEYTIKQSEEENKKLELEKQRKMKLLAQQEAEEKATQLQIEKERQKELIKQKKLQESKVIKDSHKILPFVNIKVSNNLLEIFIDKRYKLINQDILAKPKKFLFDFRATESFYTVRKALQHKDFKSFSIGTHMEKNFFRVVVDLTDDVENYKETINSNNSYIKIEKINR